MIGIATTTPNIGLHITPEADVDKRVQDWRNEIAGDGPDSNMMKLDSEIGEIKRGKANLVDSKVPVAELPSNLITFTGGEVGEVVDAPHASTHAQGGSDPINAGQVFSGETLNAIANSTISPGTVVRVIEMPDVTAKMVLDLEKYLSSPRTDNDLTVLKNTLTVSILRATYFLRKNRAGDQYVAVPPMSNLGAAKTIIGNLANDLLSAGAPYYDSSTGKVSLTWEQIQYYFVEGTIIDKYVASTSISSDWGWYNKGIYYYYAAFLATRENNVTEIVPYKIAISLSDMDPETEGAVKVVSIPLPSMSPSTYDPSGKKRDVFGYADTKAGFPAIGHQNLLNTLDKGGVLYVTDATVVMKTKFDKLLEMMYQVATDTMSEDDFRNPNIGISIKILRDVDVILRRSATVLYTVSTARSQAAVYLIKLARAAINDPAYVDTDNATLKLTWYQVQYATLFENKGALVDADTAHGLYNWIPATLAGVVRRIETITSDNQKKAAEIGAEARNVHMDDGKTLPDAIQELKDNPALTGGVPIVTTYTPEGGVDGRNYEVDIPGMKFPIRDGTKITIIPHIDLLTKTRVPTLQIKGNPVGAHVIFRSRSHDFGAALYVDDWSFMSLVPYALTYFEIGDCWIMNDNAKPMADDLDGIVPVKLGGTGIDPTATPIGSYLTTNGADAMVPKTPEEVASDIVPHIDPINIGIPTFTTYTPEGGVDGVNYAIDFPNNAPYYPPLVLLSFHTINKKNSTPLLDVMIENTHIVQLVIVIPTTGLVGYGSNGLGNQYLLPGMKNLVLIDPDMTTATIYGGIIVSSENVFLTKDRYMVGGNDSYAQTKTPEEVREHIGAAPSSTVTNLLDKLVSLSVITQAQREEIETEVTV